MPRKALAEHYYTETPSSKPAYGIIHTSLRGLSLRFLTAAGVFARRKIDLGTMVLIESMILPKEGNVLDIGCGYGPVGIAAASLNPGLCVYMTDVNSRAVRLACKNAELNRNRNVIVRHGNLYEPVADIKFDCILSNPPVTAGMSVVRAIISKAPLYMRTNALFEIVVRSKVAGTRFAGFLEEAFGNSCVLARQSGFRVFLSEKKP